jgi:hypothetical protein
MKRSALIILLLLFSTVCLAQKKKISLRDSIDHAIDLSDYIIDANGFVPLPVLITEPALGGFGFGLVPIFLKKQQPYLDSVNGQLKRTPVAPDITGGMGIYTANKSWILGGFRSGTWVKQRIKYTVGAMYANVNMSFYRTLPQTDEKEYKFNFRTVPIFLQATKRISISNWYLGMQYLFLKTDVNYEGTVPDWVKPKEVKSIVSQLGGVIEFDNRDNVFTPNKGLKLHVDGIRSDKFLGSDFNYWRLNYYTYMYKRLSRKLIGGFRFDGAQVFEHPPFYLLPYINLRGIPTIRYQGNAVLVTEGELRWDFYRRWSIMGFGGVGKAFNDWSEIGSAPLEYSVGSGFRYLLARKFKLRVGVDVAKGPEEWAYYIVFGSNWLK